MSGSAQPGQRAQQHPDIGAPPPAGAIKYDVREHGLYGELYVPAHRKHLPILIALGGAEGGLDTVSKMAATLVPSGYADCLPHSSRCPWSTFIPRLSGLRGNLRSIPIVWD